MVPAIIFTDTYDWDGMGTVTVTVDDDAPGHEGLYLWNYHLVNDEYASGVGMFALQMEGPGEMIQKGSSTDWRPHVEILLEDPTKYLVSWDNESLQIENRIPLGGAADFWFTTLPTAVLESSGLVSTELYGTGPDGPAVAPAPAIVVNTPLDEETDNGLTSLREAIASVNSRQNLAGVWRVDFAANMDGATITLDPTKGQLTLTRKIFINGPANRVTVQRDPGTAVKHRIFQVDAAITATLERLILLNGDVTGSGGAVWALGNLNAQDCEIRNNRASDGGGGIAAAGGGSLDVADCLINGNTASIGGGVYIGGGTATITSGQIGLNYASLNGGGVYIEPSSSPNTTTVTLDGVDVAGNQAQSLGAGVYAAKKAAASTTLTLKGNTNIHDNLLLDSAGTQGGGVYFGAGTLTLAGVTIANNSALQGDGMYRVQGTTVAPNPNVTYTNDQEVVGP